jgi:hypothetical protein
VRSPTPAVEEPVVVLLESDLDALAVAAGSAWASGTVGALRAQDRTVSGGWPGTLREARARVMIALSSQRGPTVAPERLEALARTANASARTAWSAQAEPDLEP